jgi:hypothetical protein
MKMIGAMRGRITGGRGGRQKAAATIASITNHAGRTDWREAVLHHLQDAPDLLRYVGDERGGDWRFLLPAPVRGKVLCLGGALSPVPLTLARSCEQVEVRGEEAESSFLLLRAEQEDIRNIKASDEAAPGGADRSYDLVAALRSSPSGLTPRWAGLDLKQIAAAVRPSGWLYLEVDRPALLSPPRLMRARLKRLGFSQVVVYWPKPTLSSCEILLPIEDRRIQRYYVGYIFFAMSPVRRLLRRALAAAVALRLFEFTLPQYVLIAHLGEAGTRS